jgi:hypothetical protein
MWELRAEEEGAVGTSLPAAASFTRSPRLIRRTCRPSTGKVNRLWNDHAVGRVGLDGHGWRMWRLVVLFRVVEDAVVVGNVASPAPDARSYRVDGRTKVFSFASREGRRSRLLYQASPRPVHRVRPSKHLASVVVVVVAASSARTRSGSKGTGPRAISRVAGLLVSRILERSTPASLFWHGPPSRRGCRRLRLGHGRDEGFEDTFKLYPPLKGLTKKSRITIRTNPSRKSSYWIHARIH